MNGNIAETANFQPIQETLTLVNNGCKAVSGDGTFNYGTTEQFSASVPSGYAFSGWNSPSTGGYSGTNNPSSVTLDGAITETATCTAIPTFALSEQANPLQGGTVLPGTGIYQQGKQVQISESPAVGYQFVNWQGSGNGAYSGTLVNPPPIQMNNAITEIANFQPMQETLTLDNNGCLGVSGSGTFNYGTTEQFSASVPTGYTLNWTSQSLGGYSGPNNPASVVLDGPIVETANCTQTSQQNFAFNEQANPAQGGTVYPGSANYTQGKQVQISENPAPGYQFEGWQGSGNGSYTGNLPNPPAITINNAITETANFQLAQDTLTLVNNDCLSVSGGGTFNYGATEQFSAAVPKGYTFSGWSSSSTGGYNGTNNPSSVLMDDPITETATCTPEAASGNTVYVLTSALASPSTAASLSVMSNDQISTLTNVVFAGTPLSMTPDTADQVLFIGETGPQQTWIQKVSQSQGTINTLYTSVAPNDLLFISDVNGNFLYVTGQNPQPPSANMQIVNETGVVSLDLPIVPTSMTPSNNGLDVYAVGSTGISVVPNPQEVVSATIPVQNASFITMTPDGQQAYASQPGSVSIIDTATNEQIATVAIPGDQNIQNGPAVFTTDNTKAYVGNSEQISVIDRSSLQVTSVIYTNLLSEFIAISPDSNYVYYPNIVNEPSGGVGVQLDVLSTATDSIVATIPLASNVSGTGVGFNQIMFSKDGTEAYIAGGPSGSSASSLYVIDTATLSLKATLQLRGPIVTMNEIQQ